jgi:hypothetical protein
VNIDIYFALSGLKNIWELVTQPCGKPWTGLTNFAASRLRKPLKSSIGKLGGYNPK